jgi:flagellar hook protein FlgE
VIAHNIANAETVGFKKSRVEFADIVAGSAFTNPKMIQGIGSTAEAVMQNYAIGPIEQTGSALDIAVTGDVLYTRNGSFTMDDAGFIHDGSDNRLQIFAPGADPLVDPPIDAQIADTNLAGAAFAGLTIGRDGTVTASYADGTNEEVGKVALAAFISPSGLKQEGSSNWTATGLSGAAKYGVPGEGAYGSLLSGALERSNVDIAEELVSLITAQRYFQANAKAIDTATQISQAVINLRT